MEYGYWNLGGLLRKKAALSNPIFLSLLTKKGHFYSLAR